jgi:flotillin
MQSLPPLFSTIHEQTGIAPPTWMAQFPTDQQQSQAHALKDAKLRGQGNVANANGS